MITREQIIEALTFLGDDSQKIIVVYGLKDDLTVLKLDIHRDHLAALLDMMKVSIQESMVDKEYEVKSYRSSDERKAYYEYDMQDETDEIRLLREIPGNDDIPAFSFSDNSISELNSLILVITNGENTISLYKDISGVEKIYTRRRYIIKKSEQQFVRETEDMLSISSSFHMMRLAGVTILTDLEILEKRNGFKNIIINQASRDAQRVNVKQIVSNYDYLKTALEGDLSLSKKLVKALTDSPVLGIDNDRIISFSQTNRRLQGKLNYTADNSQIRLTNKKQIQWFLKLLNDDFLRSQLSDEEYESGNKDMIQENRVQN